MSAPVFNDATPSPVPAEAQSALRLEFVLVAITVFLSPLNYLRASFGYVTLGDVFAMLSFGVMFGRQGLPLYPFGHATAGWLVGVLMLTGGLTLGSALNGDLLNGLVVVGQYCFSLLLLPVLILQRPRHEVILLIKIFVASMILVMLHGAYAVEYTPDDLRFVSRNGRLAGLVERENATGALAAMSITFTLWLYFIGEIRRWLLPLLLAPLVWGLLLTGSNSGLLLAAIGIFSLALLSGAIRVLLGMVVAVTLLVVVVQVWGKEYLPEIFVERVFGALESGDISAAGTFDDRLALMREAWSVTRRTIFLGLGADQYRVISMYEAPVHNAYLLLLAEGGLVSLMGHVLLIMTSLYLAFPVWRAAETRWFGVITLTLVLMLGFAQMGITHYYGRFWIMPWILAMAASVAASIDRDEVPA